MSKKKAPRIPKYRLHKAKNLAAVTIDGRHVYLGEYGSEESRQRYRQVTAEWLASQNTPVLEAESSVPPSLAISELVERYLIGHCEHYYEKNGKRTSEFTCITSALKR